MLELVLEWFFVVAIKLELKSKIGLFVARQLHCFNTHTAHTHRDNRTHAYYGEIVVLKWLKATHTQWTEDVHETGNHKMTNELKMKRRMRTWTSAMATTTTTRWPTKNAGKWYAFAFRFGSFEWIIRWTGCQLGWRDCWYIGGGRLMVRHTILAWIFGLFDGTVACIH